LYSVSTAIEVPDESSTSNTTLEIVPPGSGSVTLALTEKGPVMLLGLAGSVGWMTGPNRPRTVVWQIRFPML
jgi:hypothetical protein